MATRGVETTEDGVIPHSKLVRHLLEGAVLVLAIVLALLIRFTIFEAALVTSGSMRPTLEVDDRVLIDHRAGLRGRWQRGDIIIFDAPPEWADVPDTLIKRVIGLPGESLQINLGKVYIDGKILDEPYVSKESEPLGDTPVIVLGPRQYFVIGDNRNNSEDSRDKGPIEEKYIRGRAVWILAPFGRFGQISLPRY